MPQPESGESHIEKLENALFAFAEAYRAEGIPVTDSCRIDEKRFQELYGAEEVRHDMETLQRQEARMRTLGLSEAELLRRREGEQLEALTVVVLNKFLAEDFVVVRTSRYDDVLNKADTLILDRKSGEIVCALDEVEDIRGARFSEKRDEVIKRNKGDGVEVKYGLELRENGIGPARRRNVPVFYFALPPEYLRSGVLEMKPDIHEISDYERKIFEAFVSLLDAEAKMLQLSSRDLTPPIQTALDRFQVSLDKMRGVL